MLWMVLMLVAMAALAAATWLVRGVEGQSLRAEMSRMEEELIEFERIIKAHHQQ